MSSLIIYGVTLLPRPSVRDQRRSQILDAFEICVARYGMEGASLERIAEEAGLARPLIRHNVGNREDLLEALVDRFLARSKASTQEMLEALPGEDRLMTLIDWLFDPSFADPQMVLVSEALIAAGSNDRKLARAMRKWTRDFLGDIASVVAQDHPDAEEGAVQAVAAGITAAFFNYESLTLIGPMTDLREASKAAAVRLARSL